MSGKLDAITHGYNGLKLGYVLVWIPLVVGLHQGRAALKRLLWSPVLAIPTLVVAGIAVAIEDSMLPFREFRDGILQLLIGTTVYVTVGYFAGRFLAAYGDPSANKHRRGAVVTNESPGQRPHPVTAATQTPSSPWPVIPSLSWTR